MDEHDDELGENETLANTTSETDWITESLDLHPVDHPASRFLGKEFLMWLWWRCERDFGTVQLPHYGKVDYWVDDRIQFRTEGDDPQVSDLKGGAPATTREAKMALAAGKIVDVAKLGFRLKEREYFCQLSGESLALGGVKVPSECDEGVDEQIYERMFLLEEITGVVDALFLRFVEQRLHDSWGKGALEDLRAWVKEP